MSAVMERLNRWADNLPVSEALPVGETEQEQLVAALVPFPTRPAVRKKIAADLKAGELQYREHRVVVL